jgi:hypothetical protein
MRTCGIQAYILILNIHSTIYNIYHQVSLLCQTPPAEASQPAASLSRVTLVGHIVDVDDDDELIQLKVRTPNFNHYFSSKLNCSILLQSMLAILVLIIAITASGTTNSITAKIAHDVH